MKRIFSFVLVFTLVFSCLPSAYAVVPPTDLTSLPRLFYDSVKLTWDRTKEYNRNLSNMLVPMNQYRETTDTNVSGFTGMSGGVTASGGAGRKYSGQTSYYTTLDIDNHLIYNPVTNNYNTYNTVNYNYDYNIYNFTTNEYNYYVQNNYTYVSYFIVDSDQQSYYYEIYYQLPDGRNSYDLTAEDVWGQYFIYDVTNYDYVAEDDGKTLALFHFDGDLKDSSANNCMAVYEGNNASYTYVDSDFGSALKMSGNDYKLNITLPENLDGDFTIEGRAKLSGPYFEKGDISVPAEKLCPDSSQVWYWTFDDPNKFKSFISDHIGTGNFIWKSGSETTYWMGMEVTDPALNAKNQYELIPSTFLKTSNWLFWLPDEVTYQTTGYNYMANYELGVNCLWWSDTQKQYKVYINEPKRQEVNTTVTTSIANGIDYTMPSEYFSFAFVRSGDTLTYYQNGIAQGTWTNTDDFGDVITLYIDSVQTAYWDELRVTNEALYSEDYVPSSQPWDTNKVFVLPETGEENQIAIKSLQEPGDLRVGGVRPTFPGDGDVYVALSGDVVIDVQQYQTNAWVSIGASIWSEGEWHLFIGWDCGKLVVEEPEEPGPTPTPDPDPDPDPDPGDGGGSWLDNIFGGILNGAFAGVIGVIGVIFTGLLTLLATIFGLLLSLPGIIGSLFGFMPSELSNLLGSGVIILFVLAIVKFIRG